MSVGVDNQNGIYLVDRAVQSAGRPLHVRKKTGGFPQNTECETDGCRVMLQFILQCLLFQVCIYAYVLRNEEPFRRLTFSSLTEMLELAHGLSASYVKGLEFKL